MLPEWELTKKRRFRLDDKDHLVLQVQQAKIVTSCTGGQIDSEWVYMWRDAKIEDLTEHDEIAKYSL